MLNKNSLYFNKHRIRMCKNTFNKHFTSKNTVFNIVYLQEANKSWYGM